ncbi:MAG TPA: hypothetical protein VLB67_08810 [Acidimicrobiia bacterium]|nr:hypothetical protein [Acidimicrobiia bacterium]
MRMCLFVLVGLVAAACSGAEDGAPSSTVTPVPPTATSTTSAAPSTTSVPTTEATPTTAQNPDRQPAPDFTLELSDGTVYASADEVRPVYMVFWAEW